MSGNGLGRYSLIRNKSIDTIGVQIVRDEDHQWPCRSNNRRSCPVREFILLAWRLPAQGGSSRHRRNPKPILLSCSIFH
ncbi:hypothetical protein VPH35_036162 [Triticum aestivum]